MQHRPSHQYRRNYATLRVTNPSLSTSPSYANEDANANEKSDPFPIDSMGRSLAQQSTGRTRPAGYTSSGAWLKEGDITDTPKRMISMAFPNPHAEQCWLVEDVNENKPKLTSSETRKQTSIRFLPQHQPRPAYYATPNSAVYDGSQRIFYTQQRGAGSTGIGTPVHLREVDSSSRLPRVLSRPSQTPMQVSMSDINHRRASILPDSPYDDGDSQSMRVSLSQPMSRYHSRGHSSMYNSSGLEPSTMNGYGNDNEYPMGRSTAISSFINEYNPRNMSMTMSRTGTRTNQTRGAFSSSTSTANRNLNRAGRPALRLDMHGFSYVDEEAEGEMSFSPVGYNPHHYGYVQDGGLGGTTTMQAVPSNNLTPWHPRPHRNSLLWPYARYEHEHEHQQPVVTKEPKGQPDMKVVFGNRNVKGIAYNADGKRDWSTDLCLFCDHNLGTCCKALWCPCIIYGRNKARIEHLYAEESVHPSHGGTCSADCAVHACLTTFCLFGWAIQVPNRAAVRRRYSIEGDWLGDCAAACFCSPCELAQESREIDLEEGTLIDMGMTTSD